MSQLNSATRQAADVTAFDAFNMPALSKHLMDGAKKWVLAHPGLQNRPPAEALKPLICGLIQQSFRGMPTESSMANKLWLLFESRGPSQNMEADRAGLLDLVHRNIRGNLIGKLHLAAVSLDLLRRARMPKLALVAEGLFSHAYADALDNTPLPTQDKRKTRVQMFAEAMKDPDITEMVQRTLQVIGKDPSVVETFVALVAEDSNWHSVKSVQQFPSAVKAAEFANPSDVAMAVNWALSQVAVFGVSLMQAASMNTKAKALTAEALKEFPELWVDLGVSRMASRIAAKVMLLTQQDKAKLPALYSQEEVKDPVAWVKFFNPYGDGTWLATEFDGHDQFFGAVKFHNDWELGYFSLAELQRMPAYIGGRPDPRIQGIERDRLFRPAPLSKAKQEN